MSGPGRQRFRRVLALRKNAKQSVEAGREYVEAYVDYIHCVEGVYEAAAAGPPAHGHDAAPPAEDPHHHLK